MLLLLRGLQGDSVLWSLFLARKVFADCNEIAFFFFHMDARKFPPIFSNCTCKSLADWALNITQAGLHINSTHLKLVHLKYYWRAPRDSWAMGYALQRHSWGSRGTWWVLTATWVALELLCALIHSLEEGPRPQILQRAAVPSSLTQPACRELGFLSIILFITRLENNNSFSWGYTTTIRQFSAWLRCSPGFPSDFRPSPNSFWEQLCLSLLSSEMPSHPGRQQSGCNFSPYGPAPWDYSNERAQGWCC